MTRPKCKCFRTEFPRLKIIRIRDFTVKVRVKARVKLRFRVESSIRIKLSFQVRIYETKTPLTLTLTMSSLSYRLLLPGYARDSSISAPSRVQAPCTGVTEACSKGFPTPVLL